jgi:DNA replication protein DnaC
VSKFNNFSKKHSLVFKGDVGLGKSHLAASILKALREQGYKVMFLTTTDLMNMIKSTFNYNSTQTQDDIIKRLESLDLLVLDDVGAEYVKRDSQGFETWASEVLFQVINSRQALPTLYTTNYSAGDFSDKYGKQGKRILSRMLNSAEIIAFDGVDQRVNNF